MRPRFARAHSLLCVSPLSCVHAPCAAEAGNLASAASLRLQTDNQCMQRYLRGSQVKDDALVNLPNPFIFDEHLAGLLTGFDPSEEPGVVSEGKPVEWLPDFSMASVGMRNSENAYKVSQRGRMAAAAARAPHLHLTLAHVIGTGTNPTRDRRDDMSCALVDLPCRPCSAERPSRQSIAPLGARSCIPPSLGRAGVACCDAGALQQRDGGAAQQAGFQRRAVGVAPARLQRAADGAAVGVERRGVHAGRPAGAAAGGGRHRRVDEHLHKHHVVRNR